MELPSAKPYAFKFDPGTTALVIIDMQRDFLLPGGFGEIQCGNDAIFSNVQSIVPAVRKVLEVSREELGLHIFHTREGHKPDLSDLPASKRLRQISAPLGHHTLAIGEKGPNGRLLVRGEYGHDIVDELRPLPGEVVIDKPGKGSFWDTTFHRALLARGITHLIFCGVTTECCVSTTCREAADRGFECCILSDCTEGFDPGFVSNSLDMISAYDGLFGYVGNSIDIIQQAALTKLGIPQNSGWGGKLLPFAEMQREYRSGHLDPVTVINSVYDVVENYQTLDPAVWISIQTRDQCIESAKQLQHKFYGKPLPPLYGLPFAIKDNIDVEGIRTTATCEAFAYVAKSTAPVVQSLLDAGGIYIGKTNMDQLATGLSGCRSPYGQPHSFHSKNLIPGGSSSGSAVAVAAGLVSFALGTDTAGSGRVPPALNGVVGFKPTKGTLSARGMVPACQSLDTVSIIAQNTTDARKVWYVLDHPDIEDPYSKPIPTLPTWKTDFRGPREGGFNFGIPSKEAIQLCCPKFEALFQDAILNIKKCGGKLVEIDYAPFVAANKLLYDASLVNERIACIGPEFIRSNLANFHPVTRSILEGSLTKDLKPWEVFQDQALQKKYTREAENIFRDKIDVLVVPSVPFHPSIEDMMKEPVSLNARMGEFTHFGNVLDLTACTVNAAWYDDPEGKASGANGSGKLPFGVTFVGGMGKDGMVLDIARVFEDEVSNRYDLCGMRNE